MDVYVDRTSKKDTIVTIYQFQMIAPLYKQTTDKPSLICKVLVLTYYFMK